MLRLRLRRPSRSRTPAATAPLTPRRRLLRSPLREPTDDSSGWSGWFGGGDSGSGEGSEEEATPEPEPQKEFYANCKEAKAAGAAPLYKDDPGYRSDLDRDGDGIACEK